MSTLTTSDHGTRNFRFDEARAEAFAERFMGIINDGALTLMISIGHRTGLFDAMDGTPPGTSHDIAERAGLRERYVREWLGAMVTGRVVEFDPATATYTLPAEHARWLARSASPECLSVTAQWLALLGSVETDVAECFRQGGGVPYERYERFNEVMAEESNQTVVEALEPHILPLVPGLVDKLRDGIDVADVGCGAGLAMIRLAELFPKSRFTGYDFLQSAVDMGNDGAKRRGLTNVEFHQRDATAINETARFDLVTSFDSIHDQVDPAKMLRQVRQAVKPDGVYLAQDIRASSKLENNVDHPIGAYLYTVSTMHCMTVSLSNCGCGLGTCWGEELAVRMLRDAGFNSVDVHTLEHDIINNYYICRP